MLVGALIMLQGNNDCLKHSMLKESLLARR